MEVNITRILGLDIGDSRIGVALSDPQGILASPLTIINRTDDKAKIEAVIDIVRQNQVAQVIVGLPRSMDGGMSQQAEKVKTFVEELGKHIEVPLHLRDERLSTVSAQRLMREIKKPRQARDDAIAAALILQGYLDEASYGSPPESPD